MSLISELSHVFCKLPSLVLISQQCQCFWKFHLYILIALLRGLYVIETLIQNLHIFLEIYKNKIMCHKCVTASVIMYTISVKNVACKFENETTSDFINLDLLQQFQHKKSNKVLLAGNNSFCISR